jgi:hypothetical protein
MPASTDLAYEFFRPLATDWLKDVPLDLDPRLPIVQRSVDSGNVMIPRQIVFLREELIRGTLNLVSRP